MSEKHRRKSCAKDTVCHFAATGKAWCCFFEKAYFIHDMELRNSGQVVRPEDVEWLAPLRFQHINVHGTDHFVLPESVAQGHHRPLRPLRTSSEELF